MSHSRQGQGKEGFLFVTGARNYSSWLCCQFETLTGYRQSDSLFSHTLQLLLREGQPVELSNSMLAMLNVQWSQAVLESKLTDSGMSRNCLLVSGQVRVCNDHPAFFQPEKGNWCVGTGH